MSSPRPGRVPDGSGTMTGRGDGSGTVPGTIRDGGLPGRVGREGGTVPGWFRGPSGTRGYPAGRGGLGSPGPGGGTDSTAARGTDRGDWSRGGARIRKYISTMPTGRGASRASSSRTPGPQTGLAPVRGVDGTIEHDYQGALGAREPRVGCLEGDCRGYLHVQNWKFGGVPPKNLLTPTSEPQIPGFRSELDRVPVNLGESRWPSRGGRGARTGRRTSSWRSRHRHDHPKPVRAGGLRRIGDLFAPRGSAVHPVLIPKPHRQVPRNG